MVQGNCFFCILKIDHRGRHTLVMKPTYTCLELFAYLFSNCGVKSSFATTKLHYA